MLLFINDHLYPFRSISKKIQMIIDKIRGVEIEKKKAKRGIKKGTVLVSPRERRYLEKLGKRIKVERLKREWTLHQTEEHGFTSWSHWQYIENGKKNINFTTLLRVSKTLKISLSDLLEGL